MSISLSNSEINDIFNEIAALTGGATETEFSPSPSGEEIADHEDIVATMRKEASRLARFIDDELIEAYKVAVNKEAKKIQKRMSSDVSAATLLELKRQAHESDTRLVFVHNLLKFLNRENFIDEDLDIFLKLGVKKSQSLNESKEKTTAIDHHVLVDAWERANRPDEISEFVQFLKSLDIPKDIVFKAFDNLEINLKDN